MPDATELEAIAAAGTRGAQAYKDAQATLAAQQQAAMQAALRGNFAASASPEAQAQLANTVAQGYRPQQAALATNEANMNDWFARTGKASSDFIDRAKAIVPVIEAQLANSLGGGGGGGGGGSGGGGGGGSGGSGDFQKTLKDQFGSTQGLIQAGLLAEAHANRDPSMPIILQARKIAVEKYGAPEYAASLYVPTGGFLKTAQDQLAKATANKNATYQTFAKNARAAAKAAPGNQNAAVAYVLAQAKKSLPSKHKKKKHG